jgi:hypothetical protein
MGVAERVHGHAGGEVQELVAVGIEHVGSLAALDHERVAPRVCRRDDLLVPLEDFSGLRAGEGGLDLRLVSALCGGPIHGSPRNGRRIITWEK